MRLDYRMGSNRSAVAYIGLGFAFSFAGCGGDEPEPSLRLAWTYQAAQVVAAPAAGPEDRIVIMLSEKTDTGMGQLLTLDAATGLVLEGPYEVATLTDHAPFVRGTDIYAVGKIGKIERHNLLGESLASFPATHLGVTSPIAFGDDGLLRIASTNGQLYGFDPSDGREVFKTTIDEGVDSPLAVHSDGTTYLASPLGRVESVKADGRKGFAISTGALASGASVDDSGVVVGHAAGIDKFDHDGKKLFGHLRAAKVIGTRIRSNGDILAWGQDGVLESLSSTGETNFRFRTAPESDNDPPTISVGPAEINSDHIVVADDLGKAHLLDKRGQPLASMDLPGIPRAKSNLIVSEKGTVVFCSKNLVIGLTVVTP